MISLRMRAWVLLSILPVNFAVAVSGELEVPSAYRWVAKEYDIPHKLFYALALTESGQSSLSNHQHRPWPWTLNVRGKGVYYPSRKDAWLALQNALAQKTKGIDIGLMQINWHYHQASLGSTWQALAPYHNLRVAAAILRRCYGIHFEWWKSVGCYHAPNDAKRALLYQERVRELLSSIEGS